MKREREIMTNNKITYITHAGIIAALYTIATLAFAPLSFGLAQFRISEALTMLPLLTPAAVPGLFVGCLVSNIIAGNGIYDIILGSFATLLAAVLTSKCKNKFIGATFPVLINAVIIGAMLHFMFFADSIPVVLCMLQVGFGQFVVVYGLGIPLITVLLKNKLKLGIEKVKK